MRTFRANPSYELVLFDRLAPDLQQACAEQSRDPDFYGALLPRAGSSLPLRAVDRDTALLFLTLREPGPLPRYVQAPADDGGDGGDGGAEIGRLVEDSVLLMEEEPLSRSLGGFLAGLSHAALRYAQALPSEDAALVAARLYNFHRLPLSPRWQKLLPDAGAVERFLAIGEAGAHRRALEHGWSRLAPRDGWLLWQTRNPRHAVADLRYKLYLSPRPEALAEGFGDLLAGFGQARAERFKIGADAAGLLRPDKVVAYFASFDHLGEAAQTLATRLGGLPAHGVPFTAEIAGNGLLSWGIDPPRPRGSEDSRSWRAWLSRELAAALVTTLGAARQAPSTEGEGREPWELALDRLRSRQVDTETWSPLADWREG